MKRGNDKYNRILKAGARLFARDGFSNATISKIAKEANVGDGTIYLYFKDKRDVLDQYFSYKVKQISDRFDTTVNQGNSAEDKLRNLIRAHLEEFQKDKDMAVLYQQEAHRHRQNVPEHIRDMIRAYLSILTAIIEQGQQEGTIRRNLYAALAKRFVLGAVEETINSWLHSELDYDLTSMADPLVDFFMHGVGKG
jgi:TetR/AcrR family fatty acid metabolism transcriptional regulator